MLKLQILLLRNKLNYKGHRNPDTLRFYATALSCGSENKFTVLPVMASISLLPFLLLSKPVSPVCRSFPTVIHLQTVPCLSILLWLIIWLAGRRSLIIPPD